MALKDLLRSFASSRRLLRDLDRIAAAQEQQTLLLSRLVDRLAPTPPSASANDLRETGPSFSRDEEQVKIADFVQQCWADLKREPTEEEICDFLDGKMERLH